MKLVRILSPKKRPLFLHEVKSNSRRKFCKKKLDFGNFHEKEENIKTFWKLIYKVFEV